MQLKTTPKPALNNFVGEPKISHWPGALEILPSQQEVIVLMYQNGFLKTTEAALNYLTTD
jgi:hypothetical protein